jgi:dihydrofolate reductase
MRKVIAAINMTLDGFCDHTAGIADDELHQHYNALLKSADVILYGRITYQLMEYWPMVVKNPTGNKPVDEFAVTIDNIDKIVFTRTLKNVEWKNTRLAEASLEEEISALKHQPGKDILVGSPGLIVESMNLNLIDELQLCVHPVIAGTGMPFFKKIGNTSFLRLIKTKVFGSGAITLYYEPGRQPQDRVSK